MSISKITEITNYLEINSHIGTAGMPLSTQFNCIADNGYQAVINLALNESPGAIPDEGILVNTLEMKYIHIPVVWENPTISDLDQFFASMQQMHTSKIFVHCVLNMRVSVFVYLYRVICLHEDHENALQDVFKIWKPDVIWQSLMVRAMT
jgi:protein tyrosine phosphatase (PTP) superfamily phosphohydrolase (DUF442 family)